MDNCPSPPPSPVTKSYVGLRGMRYQGNGENYIMMRLIICTPHPRFFR